MKTKRSGFSSGWLARHSARASATSGRSCSAARSDFFEREIEKLKPVPQASDADRDLAFGEEPRLKFGERDVGLSRNACAKGIIVRRELRPGTATGRACGHFAGHASPDQSLVNIGDADPKQGSSHISASPTINGRHHTLTQVLRIWLAHQSLRVDSTRRLNHKFGSASIPQIPSILKML